MPNSTSRPAEPALLFVPDISGFTRFVQATEIEHSRHIVEELLETIIDANDIGLEVSEVEGDAVLFFRFGPTPTADEFFRQVRDMFIAFHTHLQLFESQRICNCGACAGATGLSLKFVAHYGSITRSRIKDHDKLFGSDVITAHRLLKNDIAHHEYALYTDNLSGEWAASGALAGPSWATPEIGEQGYDVGRVTFACVRLDSLRQEIPPPSTHEYSIPGVQVPLFSCEREVDAPMDLVFNVVADLSARLKWMAGAKSIDMLSHQVNRVGTTHRCVVDNRSPVMVTSGFSRSDDRIMFAETDEDRLVCSVYVFERLDDTRSRVHIDAFVRNRLFLKLLYGVLLRKKFERYFDACAGNLKRCCEELYRSEKP